MCISDALEIRRHASTLSREAGEGQPPTALRVDRQVRRSKPMTNFLSFASRQPRRRHPGFMVFAGLVIFAAFAYGVLLNSGMSPS
jgi:hypothetical protein